MKVLFVLLLLGGALFGVLHFTGTFSFDPNKQAADVRAAVDQVGTPWTKIAQLAEPRKWQVYNKKKTMIGGQEVISYKPGPEMSFKGNTIAERLKDGSLPGGFAFSYHFGGDAFRVKFDAAGDVEYVQDLMTQKDLLDQR